ncbi:glycosyltransferase family 4 protein [Puia sp. P3]|uniref:glycosyltransferase family 4 protein n=1 Tax=Puia sp. P3 TaxID=3423952 RepID=UPI003D67BC74
MANRVRLLECIRQGQIGGGETHLLSLVENIDKERFDPVVLSFTEGPMVDRLRAMGIPTHVIYTEKPFDVSKRREVRQFLERHGVELIHAHGTRAASNVMHVARQLKIPVVYTVHGWSFHSDQSFLVRNLRKMGERYLTSRSSLNISVSASNKQTGVEAIRGFRSQVINNGIDRNKFDPASVSGRLRQELGIAENEVLILFIARFTAHKQPLTLMKAFKDALPEMPDMRLVLVGDGDQKAEAQALLEQWGLGRKICLLPFRQDVPEVLASADVYVLPSLWEGLPIGLLEAMAMGKAVVATNVDGTREVVRDGENGLMVGSGSVEQLAKALITIAKDGELRGRLGRCARETVRSKFDAAAMTREIEAAYTEVLKQKEN